MKYFLLLISCYFASAFAQSDSFVDFLVYRGTKPSYLGDTESGNPVEEGFCKAGNQLAVIVPGWKESCSTAWVRELISNLRTYRGDCIICMDYSYYWRTSGSMDQQDHQLNPQQQAQFRTIRDALRAKLEAFSASGLNPSSTYMFGFGYGAQLVFQAGSRLPRKIKEIDVCEPVYLGFTFTNPTDAAENVQCIYTGDEDASTDRRCHQNWNMGHCGKYQDAATSTKSSHKICPDFYNSAFRNNFNAIRRPWECLYYRIFNAVPECEYPRGFKMGYMQDKKKGVCGPFGGNLFAKTTMKYPYN